MENQVQSLKLNVTNIKNSLFKSNKVLKKLKSQKKDLFFRIEKKREFRREEKRIETPNLGVGSSFSKINDAVTSPVRSIFDRILDFFGLIALGIVVNKLPEIVQKIDNFFNSDFIKNVGSILETVGKAFESLGSFIGGFSQDKQKEYEGNLKEIDKTLDDSAKDFDNSDSETKELEDLIKTLGVDIENLNKELDKKSGNDEEKSKNQWWDFLDIVPNRNIDLKTPQQKLEPPSGTGGPTGGSIPRPKPDQKLSSGGTVKGDPKTDPIKNKKIHQPKQTPQLKEAKRSSDQGFTGFSLAVNNISESIEKDGENVKAFAELAEKIRILNVANSGIRTDRPPGTPPPGTPPPGATPPGAPASPSSQYRGQTFASGAWIDPPDDPDGQDTGLNMALSGGVGTPIYAPYDLIYRSKGRDGNPSVGLDGNADPLGPSGRGFGYYGAYFFEKDGKEYEVLLGHFRDLPYKGSKDGEVIPRGTLLGYQGASGRSINKQTGGPLAHISLHVNGVGFRNNNTNILVDFAEKLTVANPGASKAGPTKKHQGPTINPPNSGNGGGNRKLLNTSNNSGNQSVFIYAVQPVVKYVPFGYPVPIDQESTPQVSEPPQLPSIWRQ